MPNAFRRKPSRVSEGVFYSRLPALQKKKTKTNGEDLIPPAARAIIQAVLCNDAARKVDIVMFSGKTLARNINEIALDVSFQLLEPADT